MLKLLWQFVVALLFDEKKALRYGVVGLFVVGEVLAAGGVIPMLEVPVQLPWFDPVTWVGIGKGMRYGALYLAVGNGIALPSLRRNGNGHEKVVPLPSAAPAPPPSGGA